MSKIGDIFKKSTFVVKKHSPEILIVSGVIGVVASTVLACKATTKIGDILDNSKEEIETIKEVANDEKHKDEYTEHDKQKDLAIVYTQTAVKILKLYAPAVILGGLSISGIIASNNILKKRNVALAAAYTVLDKGFKEYKERVVDRFGKEVDDELTYGIRKEKLDKITIDDEGKEKKTKEEVAITDKIKDDDFTFFFDEASPYWEKNGNYNRMFLAAQQQYANDKLRANGYLFLNDVLDSLGIPRTKAGQIIGWTFRDDNPNGDNYVDFGVYETFVKYEQLFQKELATERYFNKHGEMYERVTLLNFNVDGPILNNFSDV